MRTISTKQKWARVDAILDDINAKREAGEDAPMTPLEEYVDAQFSGNKSEDTCEAGQ